MPLLPIFSHFGAGESSRWLIPSSSALNPQAAPPLRKYSSGVPRAAQEMLCMLWVSQAIFCPGTGGRLGQEQPGLTYSAVLSPRMVASTVGSGHYLVSQCLSPVIVSLFEASGQFLRWWPPYLPKSSAMSSLQRAFSHLSYPFHTPFSELCPALGKLWPCLPSEAEGSSPNSFFLVFSRQGFS